MESCGTWRHKQFLITLRKKPFEVTFLRCECCPCVCHGQIFGSEIQDVITVNPFWQKYWRLGLWRHGVSSASSRDPTLDWTACYVLHTAQVRLHGSCELCKRWGWRSCSWLQPCPALVVVTTEGGNQQVGHIPPINCSAFQIKEKKNGFKKFMENVLHGFYNFFSPPKQTFSNCSFHEHFQVP